MVALYLSPEGSPVDTQFFSSSGGATAVSFQGPGDQIALDFFENGEVSSLSH